MEDTIGTIAKKFKLNPSTLRYYDAQGLIPAIKKNEQGMRLFDEEAVSTLFTIECLKKSGMSLKEIKTFITWCQVGDESLGERLAMFNERKEALQAQISELEETLAYIDYKISYYTQAVADQTEAHVKDSFQFHGVARGE
ncbi:MerR family transcriptional regulator [Enterococcus sp. DIV0876]|uniref:MerR family transcriptional regulator n=1 Tax=Enterococcus sp. DIV0876 TaxID=2774633 RepID=UPI003D2FC445